MEAWLWRVAVLWTPTMVFKGQQYYNYPQFTNEDDEAWRRKYRAQKHATAKCWVGVLTRDVWVWVWGVNSASLVSQTVKNLPAMRVTWVPSLVGTIPWRREWQPTPVFFPGESPWTEEPGRPQSRGSQESNMTVIRVNLWQMESSWILALSVCLRRAVFGKGWRKQLRTALLGTWRAEVRGCKGAWQERPSRAAIPASRQCQATRGGVTSGCRVCVFFRVISFTWASLIAQLVKNPPAMQET